MANAVRFKHTTVPRQPHEIARFKVTRGPDQGAIYVITGGRVLIGRGEENDLILTDLKASRVHALVKQVNSGSGWVVQDHKSANGILVNGKSVKEAPFKSKDTLELGETVLEFLANDIGTNTLMSPGKATGQSGQTVGMIARRLPTDKRTRLVLFGVIALGVVLWLMDSPSPPAKSGSKQTGSGQTNLATYLPTAQYNKTAEGIFKYGLREYLAGNYNRARTQFETVLQIVPGHPLASLYLENSTNSVKEAVKSQLEYGQKALMAGKLRESKTHFDRVLRLLYKDQTNPSYIEAREQYEKVTKLLSQGGAASQ